MFSIRFNPYRTAIVIKHNIFRSDRDRRIITDFYIRISSFAGKQQ